MSSNGLRRIVLADDTVDLRVLLTSALVAFGGFEVVGEAGDGREAVQLVDELRPDAILLDLSMPELDGLEAIPLIRSVSPHTAIIVLSGFDARTFAGDAISRGAAAYLQKGTPLREIHRTLIEACGGTVTADAAPTDEGATDDEALAALATLAHELRTPVAVAMGFAELLGSTIGDDVDRSRYAASAIRRAMRQVTTLIETSLDAQRLAAGTLELVKEPIELNRLVEDLVGDLDPVANGRHLVVSSGIDVEIVVDPSRIRQILLNLLTNAIRHAPGGSEIHVSLGSTTDAIEIAVRDHGPGVPLGQEDAIFDRFWTTNEGRRGTGLGLYVARALAEHHGGELIHERPSDGGARFVLRVPA